MHKATVLRLATGHRRFFFPDTEGSMKHHDPFEQRDKKVWQQRSAEGH